MEKVYFQACGLKGYVRRVPSALAHWVKVYAYLSLLFIVAGSILMYLIVKSSDKFSVEEMEKNADEFAGIIKDSHGPVTSWLWVAYIALIVWAVAYLIQHMTEFTSFP